ncbi:hypothetical protein [Paenarthrobacter sp. NCHU4564]|uniref:hypothetical protein n=1 Tax=Paenarthrobacter sp. NCHU4564 TaxID=3451353 RepID=UPI003F961F88
MTRNDRPLAALSPSPRHMRRRRFRRDVDAASVTASRAVIENYRADTPGKPPAVQAEPARKSHDQNPVRPQLLKQPRRATLHQKRVVALIAVILVTLSIPILALTLIFAP